MTTDEKHEQRMKALDAGNELRYYRRDVKRDIAACAVHPQTPLMQRDPRLDGMRVEEYLLAVPGIGRTRLDVIRRTVGIRPETQFGNLTDRQRAALAMWLRRHVEKTQSCAAARDEAVVA